jgi:two-component system cell cycle sensor histidine kinase/response regulator CckA
MAEAADMPSSVLVVDDEPIVLQLFSRVLSEKGLRTRTASSAEEALKLLEQGGIACVLADKNMPGMDGIEMLRRVREAQPHCAFIVMTGYASTESAIEALRLGAVDYLQKPFEDLDQVAQRIEEAIEQVRSEMDRSAALARLGVFQRGDLIDEAPEAASDPGAPIQMLEARVRQATEDLRARCLQLLSRLVASKGAGREVLLSGERILDEVRRARKGDEGDDLARIERMLEEHLALARHAQSR